MRVRGLPFTVLNGGVFTACAAYYQNINLGTDRVLMAGFLDNSTDIFLSTTPTGGGAAVVVTYDAAGGVWLSGTYEV
jgi:hypothetical protein